MAKKKKHSRKKATYKARSQRRVDSRQEGVEPTIVAEPATSSTKPKVVAKPGDDTDRVVAQRARKDVRHSLLLAGAIVAGLIAVWMLFSFTSVGPTVFKAFKLN